MHLRIALCFFFLSTAVFAGKLEKGFQALDIYNYFEAKNLFEKALKKEVVGASYGLSLIYFRSDNPFYNLDSARNKIVTACDLYPSLPVKKKIYYNSLKIDSLTLYEYREIVGNELFIRAKLNHTVKGYEKFLADNFWSKNVDSVIYLRDHLAFQEATATNTSLAFASFLNSYPNSVLKDDAQAALDRLTYLERTQTNNFIDYVSFVKDFPTSPYRSDSEDQIFEIYTKTNSLESYKNFIATYPENRNVLLAWKKMFSTYLQDDYSIASIQAFQAEFKDYPFQDEIEEQLNQMNNQLYPIKVRNKWGYINAKGDTYIKPMYDMAEQFYEGLAIVGIDGKYGFINKMGELIIDAIFEDAYQINEGHAVVQINEKWGLINRNGEFVIAPAYEDLGNLSEGKCYFLEGDLYGYFDRKGIVRLKPKYTNANNFSNNRAVVSSQGFYGLIDEFGTTYIPYKFERLVKFNEDVYAGQFDGLWGLIKENGDTIVPFIYDYIGEISNNRAIVEKDDMFNFINAQGKVVLVEWIDVYPEYRQLAKFSNNYARIEYDDGENLIDVNGKKLYAANKEEIGVYGDLIAFRKGEKWGYVNKSGTLVIPMNFTSAESFNGKLAKAGGAPLVGIINTKGEYVIDPFFESIEFFNDTLLITKSRGDYGILLTNGDTLLNFHYLSIVPYSKEVLKLQTKEAVFYYQVQQNKFIRKEE